jgi:hypothetical protein
MPRRTLVTGSSALIVVVLVGLALTPGPVVSMTTGPGERIFCRPVDVGEPFALVFQHSMYGGEVREEFKVQDDQLLRTGMTTENAAAAEYYAYDGRVLPDAAGYRVVVAPLPLDELPIVLDRVGQHRLRFADTEVALTEAGDAPLRAVLDVGSMPMIARVLKMNC